MLPPGSGAFFVMFKQTRTLKVEKTGDYFYAKVKPAIRLKGNWLARAGFPPNSRARIEILANGVLQITNLASVANLTASSR